jgi:purine nucleoside phosphorylase
MSALSFSSTNTLNVNATSAENIARLARLLPAELCNPQVGIVCGSGLGTLAESITQRVIVPYSVLQGFGQSSGASYLASGAELAKIG